MKFDYARGVCFIFHFRIFHSFLFLFWAGIKKTTMTDKTDREGGRGRKRKKEKEKKQCEKENLKKIMWGRERERARKREREKESERAGEKMMCVFVIKSSILCCVQSLRSWRSHCWRCLRWMPPTSLRQADLFGELVNVNENAFQKPWIVWMNVNVQLKPASNWHSVSRFAFQFPQVCLNISEFPCWFQGRKWEEKKERKKYCQWQEEKEYSGRKWFEWNA